MKPMLSIDKEKSSVFLKRVTRPMWLLTLFSMIGAFGVYWVINHLIAPKYMIWCEMDDYIPFLANFALAYVYWFGFLPVAFVQMLWHKDDNTDRAKIDFIRFMRLYFISWVICLICYLLFPSAITFRPTPDEIGYDSFCTAGLALTYSGFDLPNNVIPSLHCTSTLACCVAMFSSDFVRRSPARVLYYIYYVLFAFLICSSTVFVKQHSILDFFASAAIIIVLYPLVYKVDWTPVVERLKALLASIKK